MNGHDYIAVVPLTTLDERESTAPGERCDRVPAVSLGWLLEQGLITLAPPAPSPAAAPVTAQAPIATVSEPAAAPVSGPVAEGGVA